MQEFFEKKFGKEPEKKIFSPGRVNLIGEHTDYNGGHVFPCAISLGTYALVANRKDNITRVFSTNFSEAGLIEFPMKNLRYDLTSGWANYLMGVVEIFNETGYKSSHGFDILISGTLPNGAGLSSSASIEVLMATILNDEFNFGIDKIELVQLSQQAENKFVGMNCGIMDQFAVGMGKKDCAILLDCNTLDYRYVPIKIDNCSIVITNTNKKHELTTSAYNERRMQCEHALSEIQKVRPEIKSWGELTNEEFEELQKFITDPLEKLRARHAVEENQRVLEAVIALENEDLKKFGQLMHDSHKSLCENYDVTGIELDTLAELAWKINGCIGSRMTGGGFGGCTVSLVENSALEDFKSKIASGYKNKVGYAPSFYVANISEGTHKVEEK